MQTGSQAARQAARQIRTERGKRVAITVVMSVVKARERPREGSERRTERERVRERERQSAGAHGREMPVVPRVSFPLTGCLLGETSARGGAVPYTCVCPCLVHKPHGASRCACAANA
jgi:hypothetical protein